MTEALPRYGIASHGIARLGYYVNLIAAGLIDVEASPVVERETAVTAVVDGGMVSVLPWRASPWRRRTRGLRWFRSTGGSRCSEPIRWRSQIALKMAVPFPRRAGVHA